MKNIGKKAAIPAIIWWVVAIVGIGYLMQQGIITNPFAASGQQQNNQNVNEASTVSCEVAPAYTYQAVDALNGFVVGSGTTQIKSNGGFPTTALAAPPAGKSLYFWYQNSSHYCDLSPTVNAGCGPQILQTNCYQNASTVTLTLYQEPAHTALTATTPTGVGATNISIGANGLGSMTLTVQGTNKQKFAPFGGTLVIEVPNSVTSVTAAGLQAGSDYPLTYSVAAVTNIYKTFRIPAGWDAGDGSVKSIPIQVQNGATDITTSNIVVKIIPAYYYVSTSGNIVLGLERDQNADTTRNGLNFPATAAAIS